MSGVSTSSFELRGRFAGFFRDVFGTRQMAVRIAGEEAFFEISKALHREIEHTLTSGQELVITGDELSPEAAGRRRRVVSQVRAAELRPPLRAAACPIRVCANKKCWQNGGQALWRALETKIAEHGLMEAVALKASPCMDQCKIGPNVEVRGHDLHRCSAAAAEEILAPFLKHPPEGQGEIPVSGNLTDVRVLSHEHSN